MPIVRDCEVCSLDQLVPGTYSLWVEAGELALQAQPGQFVHVSCGDALLLRRPISLCRREGTRLNLVFACKGEGTRWLARRRPGQHLSLLGPLGHGFTLPRGKVLLAGGGIGVPPLLFAACQATEGAIACLGFRSADQAILTRACAQVCEQTYLVTDDGTLGTRGYVADAVDAALEEHPEISAVLACGPRIMLKTVAQAAENHGVPCQVSMEERMGCGIGACLVCAVQTADGSYLHVCKDGPVFDSGEVNWDA